MVEAEPTSLQGYYIALRGIETEMEVAGSVKKVIPFVGAYSIGSLIKFGIGVLSASNSDQEPLYFWGPVYPHKLIQSWRAMKLLEEADKIDETILQHCWYGVSQEKDFSKTLTDEHLLADIFCGEENAKRIVKEALTMTPQEAEYNEMIEILKNHGIDEYSLQDTFRKN